MIIRTSTDREIRQEVERQFRHVQKHILNLVKRVKKKIKGVCPKERIIFTKYKCPNNGNEWWYILSLKKNHPIGSCKSIILCRYETGKGSNFIAVGDPRERITVYTYHFFKRFRERGSFSECISSKDLVIQFFAGGNDVLEKNIRNQYDKAIVFSRWGFGFQIRNQVDNVAYTRTFVTLEMLRRKQRQFLIGVISDLWCCPTWKTFIDNLDNSHLGRWLKMVTQWAIDARSKEPLPEELKTIAELYPERVGRNLASKAHRCIDTIRAYHKLSRTGYGSIKFEQS